MLPFSLACAVASTVTTAKMGIGKLFLASTYVFGIRSHHALTHGIKQGDTAHETFIRIDPDCGHRGHIWVCKRCSCRLQRSVRLGTSQWRWVCGGYRPCSCDGLYRFERDAVCKCTGATAGTHRRQRGRAGCPLITWPLDNCDLRSLAFPFAAAPLPFSDIFRSRHAVFWRVWRDGDGRRLPLRSRQFSR